MGVSGYVEPVPAVVIPDPRPVHGHLIMVTTAADSGRGSLRAAIETTNNAPAAYTIRFDPSLAGRSLKVSSPLPELTGGNTYVDGDVIGDGKPHMTLVNGSAPLPNEGAWGLVIESSGNRIHALALQNFNIGVLISARSSGKDYSGNEIDNLSVISRMTGIGLSSAPGANNDSWTDTLIANNSIESNGGGIEMFLNRTSSGTVRNMVVAGNAIHIVQHVDQLANGISLVAGLFAGGDSNQIDGALIVSNAIDGNPRAGIRVAAGDLGGRRNTASKVRIIGNHVDVSTSTVANGQGRQGIVIQTGDGGTDFAQPDYRPITYGKDNRISNLWINGNTIAGVGNAAISLVGSTAASSNNQITNVRIEGNAIDTHIPMTGEEKPGILLLGSVTDERVSGSANELASISVRDNTIRMSAEADGQVTTWTNGGVLVVGGISADSNRIHEIRIENNTIDTPTVGINLLGGSSKPGGRIQATGNRIEDVGIHCNLVAAPPSLAAQRFGKVEGMMVIGGDGAANGNFIDRVSVSEDLVNGVPDALLTVANTGPPATDNHVDLGSLPPSPSGTQP